MSVDDNKLSKPELVIAQTFAALKKQSPLVVNITNFVVMNNTANALLAIGASPIMAHSQDEMRDLLMIANSLVINMGTLDSAWIACMKYAITEAVALGKPIVLDPVGCGASKLRTDTARQLCELAAPLQHRFTVRGNGSEVMALMGEAHVSKGVDSVLSNNNEALLAAVQLRARFGCDVVVSGAIDYVVGERCFALHQGSEMMTRVTGMGCTLTALTGAFAGINAEHGAGLTATAIMGVAGKLAAQKSQGPGSFQVQLLDTLYHLTESTLMEHLQVTQCDTQAEMC